jgi:phage baseplate assembly protein W
MNPTYGVGLKRYLFQYNNDNIIAEMRDRIVEQLRVWEPCVDPDKTTLTRGLDYTGEGNELQTGNVLNLTLTVYSIYGEALEINL